MVTIYINLVRWFVMISVRTTEDGNLGVYSSLEMHRSLSSHFFSFCGHPFLIPLFQTSVISVSKSGCMRPHGWWCSLPHRPAITQITLSSVKHCLSLREVDCLLLHNSHVKVLLCIIVLQEHSLPFLNRLQLLSNLWWGWLTTHLYEMRFPASSLWYFLLSDSDHFNFSCSFIFCYWYFVCSQNQAGILHCRWIFFFLHFWCLWQVYWSHLITNIETVPSVCTFLNSICK